MARLNIESWALSDPRLHALAKRLGLDFKYVLGTMVVIWHESQRIRTFNATRVQLQIWSAEKDFAFVDEAIAVGYFKTVPNSDLYYISGNNKQVSALLKNLDNKKIAGQAGGLAKAKKMREIKEASLKSLAETSDIQAPVGKVWQAPSTSLAESCTHPARSKVQTFLPPKTGQKQQSAGLADEADIQAPVEVSSRALANASKTCPNTNTNTNTNIRNTEDLRKDAEIFESDPDFLADEADIQAPVEVSSRALAKPSKTIAASKAGRTPSLKKEIPTSTLVFNAYANAMKEKWNIDVPRSAKTNTIFKRFIDEVGFDNALKVAEYYPGRRNPYYIKTGHPIGIMVQDYNVLSREINNGFILTHEMVKSIASDEAAENTEKLENEHGISTIPDAFMSEADRKELEEKRRKVLAKRGSMLSEKGQ